MKFDENKAIDKMVEEFLEDRHTGAVAEWLDDLDGQMDTEIENKTVDCELIGEYQWAAVRLGFYAGYMAAKGNIG